MPVFLAVIGRVRVIFLLVIARMQTSLPSCGRTYTDQGVFLDIMGHENSFSALVEEFRVQVSPQYIKGLYLNRGGKSDHHRDELSVTFFICVIISFKDKFTSEVYA